MAGKRPDLPPIEQSDATFKRAPLVVQQPGVEQTSLLTVAEASVGYAPGEPGEAPLRPGVRRLRVRREDR